MSKKKIAKYCLVIDASVAGAAGSAESRHPTGILCRAFLMAVRNVSHRVAWTAAIEAEWNRHQSDFALEWRVWMESLGKIHCLEVEEATDLRNEIVERCTAPTIVPIVLKDCHLIEAALATDSRVASLDETARGHFSDLAAKIARLRAIVWVNPVLEADDAVKWLEQGAPAHKKRLLSC